MTTLIIFTGAPATGKSSIAEECSRRLGLPVFSKDGNKIKLFEEYGFTNHDEKKKISIRAEEELIDTIGDYISEGNNLIVDNNFKDFNALRNVLLKTGKVCRIICFYLYAEYATLAERYNERIRTKKRDISLYALNQYPVIEGITEFHRPLDARQVENIQKAIKEETYGDIVIRINTEQIETEFDQIIKECIDVITKAEEY